jgi:superfamily II helicase
MLSCYYCNAQKRVGLLTVTRKGLPEQTLICQDCQETDVLEKEAEREEQYDLLDFSNDLEKSDEAWARQEKYDMWRNEY